MNTPITNGAFNAANLHTDKRLKKIYETCQRLELERNELAQAIMSLLEIGASVTRDEDIIENKRRREIARALVKKLKEPKTTNVETTP
jgi:predicted kinase